MGDDRSMRRHAMGALVLVAACNALNGVGDLNEVACVDPCDGGADGTAAPDGFAASDVVTPAADARAPDAPVVTDGGGVSYCPGITLYVTFDGTLTSVEGIAPVGAPMVPTYTPGKFGKAIDLTLLGAFPSVLYPVTTDAGVTTYSVAQGTMALWVKPAWSQPCAAESEFASSTFARFGLGGTAGPALVCNPAPGVVGTLVHEPDGGDVYAALSLDAAAPIWADKDWNLLVATWSEGASSLGFALNGGEGSVATSAPWTPAQSPARFVRVGPNAAPLDGLVDDFAVWNRVLSQAEIRALFTSGVSLGQACGL